MAAEPWKEGDLVALKCRGEPAHLVVLARGPIRWGSEGVVDLTEQIGRAPGGALNWLGRSYLVLRPSLADLLGGVRRGAQIVTPKDAAQILRLSGLAPGDHVVEAGSGSGALTISLAHAVGPTGRVTSYDRRADFLESARANVARAGLADRVTFRERDVAQDGFDVGEVAAVVLDLPEPWAMVDSARRALAPGGYVVTYTPTYNQLERTVRALRAAEFDEVDAMEVLERGLHVGDGGTRPSFEMLGHTGFLAVGRKVDPR